MLLCEERTLAFFLFAKRYSRRSLPDFKNDFDKKGCESVCAQPDTRLNKMYKRIRLKMGLRIAQDLGEGKIMPRIP